MSLVICGGLQWETNLLPPFHLGRGSHLKIIWTNPCDWEFESPFFRLLAGKETNSQWWMDRQAALASIEAWESAEDESSTLSPGLKKRLSLRKLLRCNLPTKKKKAVPTRKGSKYEGSSFILRSIYGWSYIGEQEIKALCASGNTTFIGKSTNGKIAFAPLRILSRLQPINMLTLDYSLACASGKLDGIGY